jgi:hypothetical protein
MVAPKGYVTSQAPNHIINTETIIINKTKNNKQININGTKTNTVTITQTVLLYLYMFPLPYMERTKQLCRARTCRAEEYNKEEILMLLIIIINIAFKALYW